MASAGQLDSVRNGNRWRVAAIDPAGNRVAAERLDDGARTVFENEYLREHVSLGYAVTVHSAQGATADTTHAVLGENTTRSLLYVAMTRGRHTNTAYLYERTIGDSEYGHQEPAGTHFHVPRHESRRRRHRPRRPGQPRPNTSHRTRLRRTNTRRGAARSCPLTSQPSNDSCPPTTSNL